MSAAGLRRAVALAALLGLGLGLSACVGERVDPGAGADARPDDEALDSARSSLSGHNRLALNRLALNRLALNRLALNRLALDELGMREPGVRRWRLSEQVALMTTEDGRDVLKYAVQCALDADEELVGTVDGQSYEFIGLLGLASGWKHHALTENEQELISGCLLAHVNAFARSVSISLRAHPVLAATEEERRAYPVYEGTFFGQVFQGDMMRVYSCQGGTAEAARAHSDDRALRACTDRTEDCGIVALGRCRDICDTRTEDVGWSDCWVDGERYEQTVSVYLFADDVDGRNQRCEGRECTMQNGGGAAAILDCNGARDCLATCADGATCTVDGWKSKHVEVDVAGAHLGEVDCYDGKDCAVACSASARCDVECQGGKDCAVGCSAGARCDVDCYRSKSCGVTCDAGATCAVQCGGPGKSCEDIECRAGSTCTLECRDAAKCEVAVCEEGAACLLACHDADRCEFARCAAGATSCGNGVVACGRPCP